MLTCINGATTMPYPVETDIAVAGQAGFQAVELWTPKVYTFLETHPVAELKARLDEYGLAVATMCPYSLICFGDTAANLENLQRGAEIAAGIGCATLLVCADGPPAGMGREEALRRAGEAAARHAEAIADIGVGLAVEPLGNHPLVPGPREALALINHAGHPNVGLMMDTFHYYKSGVPLADVQALPADLLRVVHINDCEDLPRDQLTDGHRLYMGEGVIPILDMLRAVADNGYAGPVSVEIFRREYWSRPALQIAQESKASLDTVLAQLSPQ
jgi:sugar phosphate isomerase/epimerase